MGSSLAVLAVIAGHIIGTVLWLPTKPMWTVLTALFLISALLLSPSRSFAKLFSQSSKLHIGGIFLVAVVNMILSSRDRGLVENLLHAATIGSFYLFGLSLVYRVLLRWYYRRG